MMKFSDVVAELERAGVADATGEAYIILEECLGASRSDVILYPEREYDESGITRIILAREKKIPLQYALGKWYFMGDSFIVSPDCLIPRPDTEILVYEALKLLKSGGRVADLCTGSGCIGISMLKNRADIEDMTLADISSGALDIARKNARLLGVEDRCSFALCDITRGIPLGKYDMIVSNPPYIPSADIDTLTCEVKNEPRLALDGGDDGLDIVRSLLDSAPSALNEGGFLLIEFGYDQGAKIGAIMDKKLLDGAYSDYKILKDYGSNDRVLVAKI